MHQIATPDPSRDLSPLREVTTLEWMYGEGDLADSDVFGGGFCNFGYWNSVPQGSSAQPRAAASAAMYRQVFEALGYVHPPRHAVEVGVGRGWGARLAIEGFGFETIVGVDISPHQIDRLRLCQKDLVDAGRLEGRVGRAESLPIESRALDALYSVEALQHFTSPESFSREAARVLRPQARFAVATFFLRDPEAIAQLRPLMPTVQQGITRPIAVADLVRSLDLCGFEDVRVRSIGADVFPAFDAWLAIIGERAQERDSWGRNWLKAFEEGWIDYNVVSASRGTSAGPTTTASPSKRKADPVPRELLLLAPGRVALCPFELPLMTPHSVVLKTLFSGISHGTEMLLYRGDAPKFHHKWDDELRHFVTRESELNGNLPMGYESVARVQEVGSDVEDFSLGDMIWLDAPHREMHVIDSRRPPPFWRLDEHADPQSLAFLALTRVALGAVHDAEPNLGGSAAVCGLGTVGQLCAQLLLRAGVRTVFGIDPDPLRLAVAERCGIIPVAADGPDPAGFIKGFVSGVDVAIEASGRYVGLGSLVRCVAPMGRVVVVSSYGDQSEGLMLGHEFHRNRISLISSMTVNGCPHPKAPLWTFERLTGEAAALLTEQSLSVIPMVTSVPFASAPDAYRTLEQEASPPLKIVLAYG